MGIIQRQAIKGTVYSYIGVVIGFITTGILFPRILTTNEIGLLKLLVSFSVLFAQFGSLGFNSVLNRLFPYFRDPTDNHKGFIAFAMLISFTGFILTSLAFSIYKPVLIENNTEDSTLLVEYVYLIIPLIFTTLFFVLFDTYNKVLYDSVLGTFLKEFLQRVFILISVLLYFFGVLELNLFVLAYVISFYIPTIILIFVLYKRGELTFRLKKEAFTKRLLKEMAVVSLFGFISGLGGLAIIHIDTLLVNKFLGISMTGIYATTFYFGTLVLIPSRSLIKISTTILADSWKEKNTDNVRLIYTKSCINQTILGLLILTGLWVNIDNIFHILPEEFEAGKYVIFFIGLANVFEMSSGVSGMVIGTSIHFRMNSIFIFIFFLLIIGLNFIFIPLYGITGAAIATALSRFFYLLMRYVFLKRKFKFEPYNYKYILLILLTVISYLSVYWLPSFQNYLIDILVRSSIVLIVFSSLTLIFNISEDVNNIYKSVVGRVFK